METIKAKVLELKGRATPSSWTLVLLAVFVAVPMSGGTLALGSFLIGASPLAVAWVIMGTVGYVYIVYNLMISFLGTLDEAILAGKDED